MNDEAVSPVVGVMMMLVVTIIIAAVVSAFSGGALGSSQKTPQMSIAAKFSQSGGFTLYHNGGDTLSVENTKVLVRWADTMGSKAMYTWEVNKSVIRTPSDNKFWVNATTRSFEVPSFAPGDVAVVNTPELQFMQARPDGTIDYLSSSIGFGHSTAIAKEMEVELVDFRGKTIAKTTVKITG